MADALKPILVVTDPDADARGGGARTLAALVIALASTWVLTLAGCASPAGIARTAVPVSPQAVGLAGAVEPGAAESALPPAWWQAFGDAELNHLVERALAENPSLKVAQSRLARAQAASAGVDAQRGPQWNASAEAMRQRYTENGLVPAPLAGSTRDNGTVQLAVSWEIDFFGRHRAALDAALGAQRAAQADMQAARVLLATQVARGYVQLARLFEQREVSARALAQREEMLSLIRQRVQAGLDTNVELRQGEGALPQTRQQLEEIDEQISLARHALAVLTAQAPHALDGMSPRLRVVQAVPVPAHVPSDLLGRRADVSAARWRVEAAARDADVAKAQFYPNVNLAAFAGVSALGLDRLFDAGSAQYGAGPAIRLPIFDAARLRANLRGKTADVDAAVETYNAAVYGAVHEAADQIASLHSIERQQAEQRLAQDAAESAYDLATQRYKAGIGAYLTVLNAEAGVLAQRRSAADLKARALDGQVALIRALGGGYQDTAQATAYREP